MSGSFAHDPPAVRAEVWTRIPIHGLFAGSLPHCQRSSGLRCACACSPSGRPGGAGADDVIATVCRHGSRRLPVPDRRCPESSQATAPVDSTNTPALLRAKQECDVQGRFPLPTLPSSTLLTRRRAVSGACFHPRVELRVRWPSSWPKRFLDVYHGRLRVLLAVVRDSGMLEENSD